MFPKPSFFPDCELNFAENLLFPASNPPVESPAIIAASETDHKTVTWAELRERVREMAAAMESHGIKTGDRVAGYLANHENTIIAMLAATSLGALWTGVSPDTGVQAVLDRLAQIEPVLLFADNAVAYNAKTHETHSKISQVIAELPSVKNLVIFDTLPDYAFDLHTLRTQANTKAQTYAGFISASDRSRALTFAQLSPDQPVYILYSSGTTGQPKPIVHASLGTLLQHKKEHVLQCDIRPGELALLLHNLHMDDVALASLWPCLRRHNRSLRRQPLPTRQRNVHASPRRLAPNQPLRHLRQIPLRPRTSSTHSPRSKPQTSNSPIPQIHLLHRLPPRPLNIPLYLYLPLPTRPPTRASSSAPSPAAPTSSPSSAPPAPSYPYMRARSNAAASACPSSASTPRATTSPTQATPASSSATSLSPASRVCSGRQTKGGRSGIGVVILRRLGMGGGSRYGIMGIL